MTNFLTHDIAITLPINEITVVQLTNLTNLTLGITTPINEISMVMQAIDYVILDIIKYTPRLCNVAQVVQVTDYLIIDITKLINTVSLVKRLSDNSTLDMTRHRPPISTVELSNI